MDTRRRFNARERLALWRLANGRCTSCGRELKPGWHADHQYPYSKGGPTDVVNGAATCPSCNEKKGDSIMNPDRPWQQRFVADFRASTERHFLLVACPAAGKTRASVAVADTFRRVVVVVPSRDVKDAWQEGFSRQAGRTSHDLTKDGMPIADHHDIVVITYQGLPRYAHELRAWLRQRSGLLILDEIHHGGESERDGPTIWGGAASLVADGAARSLLLTGTPLRTGGDRIPLVRYDANEEPIVDHRYGFREAWREDPCPIRRVRFDGHDAVVEWTRQDGDGKAELSKMGEFDDEAAALRSAFNPRGAYVEDVLLDIKEEIKERRKLRPRAAALIACSMQDHAREIAARMRELGLNDPVEILSDDDGARTAIGKFRDGSEPYAVAVRMISEGVDIPRLEVLAHFTAVRSRLFVHQLVGRVLRQIEGQEHVEAIVHYPLSWTLRQEVTAIEDALTYQIHERDTGEGGDANPSTFLWGTATEAVQAEVSGAFGTIDRGRIDALRVGVPSLGEDQAIEVAKYLLREGTLAQVDPISRTRVELNPQAELAAVRDERNKAAKSLAGLMARLGHGTYEDCVIRVNGALRTEWDGRDPARLSTDELRDQMRRIQEWRDGLE